jgi:predicted molibdopterin-dependent oxidoreductase YjgC
MFKRLPDDKRPTIALSIDGITIEAREGDSVAAALLAAGVMVARTTPVSETPRAPYCMMGVCFDCLMEIDGIGSRQACLVPVRAGMVVRTQHGARKL